VNIWGIGKLYSSGEDGVDTGSVSQIVWRKTVRNTIRALRKIVLNLKRKAKIVMLIVGVIGEAVTHVRIGAVYLGNGRRRLGTPLLHQRIMVRSVHQISINGVQRPKTVKLANGKNAKIGRGTMEVPYVTTQAQRTIPCAGMMG